MQAIGRRSFSKGGIIFKAFRTHTMSNFEERNQRQNSYGRFRAILHLSMGCMYLLIGAALVYVQSTQGGIGSFAYLVGGLMLLYGVFRIWRGFRDMKEMRRRF